MTVDLPTLDRYLQGAVVAERVRWLKRPEDWIVFVFLVGAYFAKGGDPIWSLIAVAIGFAVSGLILGLRHGWSREAIMADALRKKLPGILRRELRKGRLVKKVGGQAASLLESSAAHTLGLLQAGAEAMMLGGDGSASRDAQVRAGTVADDLMRLQLHALYGALAFGGPPLESDLAALERRERELKELAAASEAVRDFTRNRDHPEALRESLDHLRAVQAAHEELEAGAD